MPLPKGITQDGKKLTITAEGICSLATFVDEEMSEGGYFERWFTAVKEGDIAGIKMTFPKVKKVQDAKVPEPEAPKRGAKKKEVPAPKNDSTSDYEEMVGSDYGYDFSGFPGEVVVADTTKLVDNLVEWLGDIGACSPLEHASKFVGFMLDQTSYSIPVEVTWRTPGTITVFADSATDALAQAAARIASKDFTAAVKSLADNGNGDDFEEKLQVKMDGLESYDIPSEVMLTGVQLAPKAKATKSE